VSNEKNNDAEGINEMDPPYADRHWFRLMADPARAIFLDVTAV
jgi:hypothetical protein